MNSVEAHDIELLSVTDISKATGIGVRTLWRWVSAGTFPQPDLRCGRIVRWRRVTVATWIEQNCGVCDEAQT